MKIRTNVVEMMNLKSKCAQKKTKAIEPFSGEMKKKLVILEEERHF
jgi:hypothetical protein